MLYLLPLRSMQVIADAWRGISCRRSRKGKGPLGRMRYPGRRPRLPPPVLRVRNVPAIQPFHWPVLAGRVFRCDDRKNGERILPRHAEPTRIPLHPDTAARPRSGEMSLGADLSRQVLGRLDVSIVGGPTPGLRVAPVCDLAPWREASPSSQSSIRNPKLPLSSPPTRSPVLSPRPNFCTRNPPFRANSRNSRVNAECSVPCSF